MEHLFTANCVGKTKIKKRPGMAHFLKKIPVTTYVTTNAISTTYTYLV